MTYAKQEKGKNMKCEVTEKCPYSAEAKKEKALVCLQKAELCARRKRILRD